MEVEEEASDVHGCLGRVQLSERAVQDESLMEQCIGSIHAPFSRCHKATRRYEAAGCLCD